MKIVSLKSDDEGSRATVELDYMDLAFLRDVMARFSRPYCRSNVAAEIARIENNKVRAARMGATFGTIVDTFNWSA